MEGFSNNLIRVRYRNNREGFVDDVTVDELPLSRMITIMAPGRAYNSIADAIAAGTMKCSDPQSIQ
jgi:hypothetical protein